MTRAERRARTERKIKQRIVQAAYEGFAVDHPHRWAKTTPLGCYSGNCWICRSGEDRPRVRFWNEE